ncbi:hypothetical protein QR680_016531 [Steinernema hermaphroditum]|uniref:Uncharacterized protein n=1 Tax=Steinernema hermaphroditum TaxID=289476 RepID=A0AA39HBI3_9BILA|nr:hypothetical protein QR680_016531 [Steinernema hermaphroditum]
MDGVPVAFIEEVCRLLTRSQKHRLNELSNWNLVSEDVLRNCATVDLYIDVTPEKNGIYFHIQSRDGPYMLTIEDLQKKQVCLKGVIVWFYVQSHRLDVYHHVFNGAVVKRFLQIRASVVEPLELRILRSESCHFNYDVPLVEEFLGRLDRIRSAEIDDAVCSFMLIQDALVRGTLEYLYVYANETTVDGVKQLLEGVDRFNCLKHLKVTLCGVSEEEVTKVAEELPSFRMKFKCRQRNSLFFDRRDRKRANEIDDK